MRREEREHSPSHRRYERNDLAINCKFELLFQWLVIELEVYHAFYVLIDDMSVMLRISEQANKFSDHFQ